MSSEIAKYCTQTNKIMKRLRHTQEITRGQEYYQRFASGPLKHITSITKSNIMHKVSAYYNLALRGCDEDNDYDVPSILLSMMHTKKYYPSPMFITGGSGGPLDLDLTETLFRMCTTPEHTTLVDVLKVFFGHDNSDAAAFTGGRSSTANRRPLNAADHSTDRIRAAMSRSAAVADLVRGAAFPQ